MAKETKTVQCYPDDNKVNAMIEQYGSFGWELINNQRCQEYEGTTSDGYRHWSTFNKLTFQREKSSPWYGKVVDLENQHDSIMNSKPKDYSISPSKYLLIFGILFGLLFGIPFVVCVFDSRVPFYISAALGGLFAIAVVLLIVYIVKQVKCKKAHEEYLSRKRNWEKTTEKDAIEIRKKAEALVNG